jgi:NAD(P)-dependent dehydrogenase (short-subunit alcohol dehydrogenase family)
LASRGHVAVVMGTARGIGRRVALELAERGYAVAANDLDAAEETLEELERLGANALSVPGDVSDEGAVRGMVVVMMGGFERVDVLVNNAGISHISPIEETTLVDWRRVLEVNLTGPLLMCRELGKEMLERGSGSIVNIRMVRGDARARGARVLSYRILGLG